MKKRKNKILYVLHVSNKKTGLLVRVLTFKNITEAQKQKDFYDSTLNLIATLDIVIDN